MSVPPLSKSVGWTRGIAEGRNTLLDLQRQLATGQKAQTYGGLGPDRTMSLAMRSRLSITDAYLSTMQTVSMRLKVMTLAMDRFSELGKEIKNDATMPGFELTAGDRTGLQVRAENALDEALALMRTEVGGRYMFGGRDIDQNPVAKKDAILHGAGGRAGFVQHLDERRQADLGADGLGRLELAAAGSEVTIGEDHDGPLGFKISGLSTGIAGAGVTGPAGTPPEAAIDFDGATPQAGDTVRLSLALPDGTETEIVLTAVDAAPGPGEFQIGVDADETATNFEAALTDSLEATAATELAAASAFAASEDFFNYDADNPPQRIDGPPFDSAVALRDATDQDTVFWYTGDAGPGNARDTAVARIDDQISVNYGARANEEAFRWTIQNFAVLAAESFDDSGETDKARYKEMTARVAANLSDTSGRTSPDTVHSQIASAQLTIDKAEERHKTLQGVARDVIADVEHADMNEVAVQIIQLQTRLQASYQTTAILSQMSLVYHM